MLPRPPTRPAVLASVGRRSSAYQASSVTLPACRALVLVAVVTAASRKPVPLALSAEHPHDIHGIPLAYVLA